MARLRASIDGVKSELNFRTAPVLGTNRYVDIVEASVGPTAADLQPP